MSDKHTQGRLYIRTNRHPNTDGTPWGWVDLHEPGSMLQASPDGIQVTWSRGQKSEANARRLVACWNACEDEDTAMLEAIVREGTTIRRRHDDALRWKEKYQGMLCDVERQRDELLDALKAVLQVTAHLDACHATVEQAQAAIAKAEASK